MAINWSLEIHNNVAFIMVVYDPDTPSLDKWVDTMEEILGDGRYVPGTGFILDRRRVSSTASSGDVRDALDFINRHVELFAGSRWGVLQGTVASLGMARMGQILSSNLPIAVAIFEDLDAAKEWVCDKA